MSTKSIDNERRHRGRRRRRRHRRRRCRRHDESRLVCSCLHVAARPWNQNINTCQQKIT